MVVADGHRERVDRHVGGKEDAYLSCSGAFRAYIGCINIRCLEGDVEGVCIEMCWVYKIMCIQTGVYKYGGKEKTYGDNDADEEREPLCQRRFEAHLNRETTTI